MFRSSGFVVGYCFVFSISCFGFFAFVPNANAGIILNNPVYIGLNSGLVGYWSFDGPDMAGDAALDRSNQGNDGTLTNGPAPTAGKIGQALEFDGVDDYVSVSNNAGNVKTISYWIKSNDQANGGIELNSNQYIDDNAIPEGMVNSKLYIDSVVKNLYGSDLVTNGDMEANSTWSLIGSPTFQGRSSEQAHRGTFSWKIIDSDGWEGAKQSVSASANTMYKITGWVYISSGVGNYVALENSSGGSSSVASIGNITTTGSWIYGRGYGTTSSSPPSPTIWMTGFGGATTFYADDVSLKEVLIRYPITDSEWHHVVITTDTAVSASAIKLGKGGSSYLNGQIDDVRVYNRALSQDEIKRLYRIGGTLKIKKEPGIAFDATSNSGEKASVSSFSWSHTTSGSNRLLFVGVSVRDDQSSSVTSVTYNDVPMTNIREDESTGVSTSIWYLASPPTGANTIEVTGGSSFERVLGGAISLTGVDQKNPLDAHNGRTGALNVTVTTVADNAWVLDTAVIDNNPDQIDAAAGQTERWNVDGGNQHGGSSKGPVTPAGAVTMSWTNPSGSEAISAASFKPFQPLTIINKSISNGSLQQGLVGHWSFDGPDMNATQALDRSGQGNNGTLTNGPTHTIGKIGQGLEFDGNSASVDVADPASGILDVGSGEQFSISLWLKGSNVADGQFIVQKRDGEATGYQLRHRSDDVGKLRWRIDEGAAADTITNQVVLDGQWHHIVAGRNNQRHFIYIDGKLEDTTNDTSLGSLSNTAPFGIGKPENVGDAFDGLIDDVRMYKRALSADEIKRLYKQGGGR